MEGSKYYVDNNYLSGIFQKQERMGKPIKTQQVDVPFYFMKKQMGEQQRKQMLQKKIFDNPELYMSTHVKCQICNKYIQIQMVNHHSRVHFEEQQRIAKILQRGNNI